MKGHMYDSIDMTASKRSSNKDGRLVVLGAGGQKKMGSDCNGYGVFFWCAEMLCLTLDRSGAQAGLGTSHNRHAAYVKRH